MKHDADPADPLLEAVEGKEEGVETEEGEEVTEEAREEFVIEEGVEKVTEEAALARLKDEDCELATTGQV